MHQRQLFILFVMMSSIIWAQPASSQKDLKVGLVLSGGGAKGLAHIGALKVIEASGVKIDFVGGTSMGAIIGGLYASGYTAAELDSLFTNTDLDALIRDNLPRSAKTFYEKEDSERYALTLPFNNFKVSVPPAISGGQNIYNELVRLLYHVRGIENFNDLPIPFFCIATDVETGKEVLLDSGYLPEAILASGTFPSLFEPAEIDNKILIDGGVLNNYPVDEVRKLGADIIVGVDVQHGLRDRDELLSATEILLQINNYSTVRDMTEKADRTDIYIKPNIEGYSVIDFDKMDTIIKNGELAAEKHLEALQNLSKKQNIRPLKPAVQTQDSLVVNRMIITGSNNYSRGYVKGKLRFNLAEKIPFKKFQQGINNLAATGNFKSIRYELLSRGPGEDMIINLTENPNKTFIRLGLHYDDLYKTSGLINLTQKSLFVKDDVGSIDFILGDNVRYKFQYYVDKGSYWSIGFNSKFDGFDTNVDYDVIRSNFEVLDDSNINNLELDVSDFTNQFYIESVFREEFAILLGLEYKYLKYSTTTLNELTDSTSPGFEPNANPKTFFEKSGYFSAYGNVVLDTYNNRYFPSKGLFFNGDLHIYLFSSDFNNNFKEFSIAKARMGAAFPITHNLSINIETEGGFKLGTSGVKSFDFILGGYGNEFINNFIPFFGYDYLSLPGNSYVKAYGRLDLEFASKNHLLFAANIANVEDDIFRTGNWFTAPDFSGFGIGYGWDSFFGPVQVMYSWTPQISDSRFFFSIGYWF